jgi:hypothetical protein
VELSADISEVAFSGNLEESDNVEDFPSKVQDKIVLFIGAVSYEMLSKAYLSHKIKGASPQTVGYQWPFKLQRKKSVNYNKTDNKSSFQQDPNVEFVMMKGPTGVGYAQVISSCYLFQRFLF